MPGSRGKRKGSSPESLKSQKEHSEPTEGEEGAAAAGDSPKSIGLPKLRSRRQEKQSDTQTIDSRVHQELVADDVMTEETKREDSELLNPEKSDDNKERCNEEGESQNSPKKIQEQELGSERQEEAIDDQDQNLGSEAQEEAIGDQEQDLGSEGQQEAIDDQDQDLGSEGQQEAIGDKEQDLGSEAQEEAIDVQEQDLGSERQEEAIDDQEQNLGSERQEEAIDVQQQDLGSEGQEEAIDDQQQDLGSEGQEEAIDDQQQDLASEGQDEAIDVQQQDLGSEGQEEAIDDQQQDLASERQEEAIDDQQQDLASEGQEEAIDDQDQDLGSEGQKESIDVQEQDLGSEGQDEAIDVQEQDLGSEGQEQDLGSETQEEAIGDQEQDLGSEGQEESIDVQEQNLGSEGQEEAIDDQEQNLGSEGQEEAIDVQEQGLGSEAQEEAIDEEDQDLGSEGQVSELGTEMGLRESTVDVAAKPGINKEETDLILNDINLHLQQLNLNKYQKCGYFLKHQHLKIIEICLKTKKLICSCDYKLSIIDPEIEKISLNASSLSIYGCTFNDTLEAEFTYIDTLLDSIRSSHLEKNQIGGLLRDTFVENDLEIGNGELTIMIPQEIRETLSYNQTLVLTIDFEISCPARILGINSFDNGSEFYLFTDSWMNQNRQLFPCIDLFFYRTNWSLSFVVKSQKTAVICPGILESNIPINDDSGASIITYNCRSPKSSQSIGFCIGTFEKLIVDESMEIYFPQEMKEFADIIKKDFIKALDYIRKELGFCSFNFPLKIVFVDTINMNPIVYDEMLVFSVYYFYKMNNLESTINFHEVCSKSLSQLIFYHCIGPRSSFDFWLFKGLECYFSRLICQGFSGYNEYCYQFEKLHRSIHTFEKNYAYMLNQVKPSIHGFFSYITMPLSFRTYMENKSEFIIRSIVNKIPKNCLNDIINDKLSHSTDSIVDKDFTIDSIQASCLTQYEFFRLIQIRSFLNLSSIFERHLDYKISYELTIEYMPNKKRNAIEMLITQPQSGYMINKFHGDIKLLVQEWDGLFSHNVKIDYPTTKIDLPFSSRGRRSRRRRIDRMNAQIEIHQDLEEPESPILWIIADPDMDHCLDVNVNQTVNQWRWMLIYEENPLHQSFIFSEALPICDKSLIQPLLAFLQYSSYYKYKSEAFKLICHIVEKNNTDLSIVNEIQSAFKQFFFSRINLLMLPVTLKTGYVADFLIKRKMMLSYSEISYSIVNHFIISFKQFKEITLLLNQSICCFDLSEFEATIMKCQCLCYLANTNILDANLEAESLEYLLKRISFLLNREKMMPTHNYIVTSYCLESLWLLMKNGAIPFDMSFFISYSSIGNSQSVISTAIYCLVSLMLDGSLEVLVYINSIIEDHNIDQHIKEQYLKTIVERISKPQYYNKVDFDEEFLEVMYLMGENALRKVSPDPIYKLMYGKEILEYADYRNQLKYRKII
ncbi:MAG: Transcription initiation factor TFIID subunit 2 [Marteilia pararefringens]